MKYFVLLCLAGIAVARPGPDAPAAKQNPLPFHFRSKGEVDGSYFYSYAAQDSSKTETRTADGNVIGGYQYIDNNGTLHQVQYQAGVDGVQVQASNLPVGNTEPVKDTPEVQRAAEEHFHLVEQHKQLVQRKKALHEEYERKQLALKAAKAEAKHH